MNDIHGERIKENDLVCVCRNGKSTFYYIKCCWKNCGEEFFDTYRVTRKYHINKYDYGTKTTHTENFQWAERVEKLPIPDCLREEIEDMTCIVDSPLEDYGEILQLGEDKKRRALYRAVKLFNRKYAIIVNHYSENGSRFCDEFFYQRTNLSLAELENFWRKKKEQGNCKWYSYGNAPGR